jgi:hypothetical protein
VAEQVRWVEADLTAWSPDTQYDLVTTHYAHPAMPQLAFYKRISAWVAPGGTLLIVGHLNAHDHHDQHRPDGQHGPDAQHGQHGPDAQHDQHEPDAQHGQRRPVEAMVTVGGITAVLDDAVWEIVTAEERVRTVPRPAGKSVELRDVVVRATRR